MLIFSSLDFVKLAASLLSRHNDPISNTMLICEQHHRSLGSLLLGRDCPEFSCSSKKTVRYGKALEYTITKGTSEN